MKSLFFRLLLILAVYECNTQFVKYNQHYYAFYHLQANSSTAILTCLGTEPPRERVVYHGLPVILNDREEHEEIYQFYLQNSREENSFVWIGGFTRDKANEFTTCEGATDKPIGYDCRNLSLPLYVDGSFSTYQAWESFDSSMVTGRRGGIVWSKQSNTWLLSTEPDDPRVNELICEYTRPCLSADIDCVAHGVCLKRTAYTEHACVCEEGFTDCGETATGTEGTADGATLISGVNDSVVYVVIAVASVGLVGGAAFAYFRMKGKSNHQAVPPGVGVPSGISVISGAPSGMSMVSGAPSAASMVSGGSMVW